MSTKGPSNSFDGIRANAAKIEAGWDSFDSKTKAIEEMAAAKDKLQRTVTEARNSRPAPLSPSVEATQSGTLFAETNPSPVESIPLDYESTPMSVEKVPSREKLTEITSVLQRLEDSLLALKKAEEDVPTTASSNLDQGDGVSFENKPKVSNSEQTASTQSIHKTKRGTTEAILHAIAEEVERGVQDAKNAETSPVPFEIGGVPLERTTSPQEIETTPATIRQDIQQPEKAIAENTSTQPATISQDTERTINTQPIPVLPKESIVTKEQLTAAPKLHERNVVRGGSFHGSKKFGTGLIKKIRTFFQSKQQEAPYDSKAGLAEAAYKVAEENQLRHQRKLADEEAFKKKSLAEPDINLDKSKDDLIAEENERVAKLEEDSRKKHLKELADAAYTTATINQERHKLHLEKLALQKAPEVKKTEVKRANIFKRLLSKKARNDFDRAEYKKIGGAGYDDFLEEVGANSYFDIADRKNRNSPESSMAGVTTSELDVLHKEYTDHKEAGAKKALLEKERLEVEEEQKKLNRTDEEKMADWVAAKAKKGFFASTKNILKKGSDKLFGFPTEGKVKETRKERQTRVDAELGDDYEAIIEKDAFSHLNTPVINNLERTKKENSIQKGLRKILLNTKEKSMEVRKNLGPEGTKLLNSLDRGAEFFDRNVSKKTRLFAGATLAATGALALYATPAIGTVAVITAAGMGVRVIAASASYVAIKRVLDAQTKKFGPTEKKLFALAGAAGAAMLGELAGRYLAPSLGEYLEEYIPKINETLFTFTRGAIAPPSIPSSAVEVLTPTSVATPAPDVAQVIAPEVSQTPIVTPEAVAPSVTEALTSAIPPELLQHTVKPGENIWNILKETLKASNYDGFTGLPEDMKQQKILDMVGKIMENPKVVGLEGNNINLIHPGEKLDFTKLLQK